MINLVTLFTGGLSAIDFALKYEKMAYNHLLACEIDKYARKQFLEFHEAPLEFAEDASKVCAKHLKGKVDLYCFGSPCQDLSLAGKRKGFDGEKSSLFRHGARVLGEIMPKMFIFENVRGLLSSNGGADYKEVEKTFRELGYHMAMKVVNAKEQGTAQNRERVFVVGFLDSNEYHNFHFADNIVLDKCLRDYLEDDVDEKDYLSNDSVKRITESDRGVLPGTADTKISPCLIAGYGKIPTDGFYIKDFYLDPDGIAKTLRVGGRGSNSAKHNFDLVKINSYPKIYQTRRGYNKGGVKDICPTITINSWERNNHLIESKIATNTKESVRKNFIRDYAEIIKSEKTVWYCECDSGFQDNKVCLTESACLRANNSDTFTLGKQFRIRRLTPRECFRLMGMNDSDIVLVNSDTQSYKIAGNGIEINTMRSIIRQLYRPTKPKGNLF